MYRVLRYLLIVLFVFGTFFESLGFSKDRILVISDNGGGAHVSTASAVEASLKDDYEVRQIFPFESILGKNWYNSQMRRGAYSSLWWLVRFQRAAEKWISISEIGRSLIREIEEYKPSLIISVVPIANSFIYDIASRNHIPFLVQSTDIYSRHFFHSFREFGKDIFVSLPFDENLQRLFSKRLTKDNFVLLGYALRPEFQESNDNVQFDMDQVRQDLSVLGDEKVVSIMIGAQGDGSTLLGYVNSIANSDLSLKGEKVHIVALCGKNAEVRRRILESSFRNPHVEVHALGQKDGAYIAALMRLTSVLISKPGGATVNEGLASNVFMLFDPASTNALYWERWNMNFCINQNAAEVIDGRSFIHQLERALYRERPNIEFCPGRQFSKNLKDFVNSILQR